MDATTSINKLRFIYICMKSCETPFCLEVSGDSMTPIIRNGEMVKVLPYSKATLEKGDIIVFCKFSDHLTVHRVVDVIREHDKTIYRTKGDNNSLEDSYMVFPDEILGKVLIDG